MKTLIPYFTIKGQAEEALAFYKECFGGETTFMQRFADTSYQISKEWKDKIAHAEFKADNIHFYVSDGFEKEAATLGNGIGMTVNVDSAEEQQAIFEQLKAGGEVSFDYFQTTIDTRLVCVVDRYGIHWYLNYIKD